MNNFISLFIAIVCLTVESCSSGELRGYSVESHDNLTYLVVEDDNGGECGPILVDGNEWQYEIGIAGEIQPGIHTIECGGTIQFKIQRGTVFHFDYWGP